MSYHPPSTNKNLSQKTKNYFREKTISLISYGISIALHMCLLTVISLHSYYKGFFLQEENTSTEPNKILIDLADLPDLPEDVSSNTPFISQRNRALKGNLSEEKGILIHSSSTSPKEKHLSPKQQSSIHSDSSAASDSSTPSAKPSQKNLTQIETESETSSSARRPPQSSKALPSQQRQPNPPSTQKKKATSSSLRELVTKTTSQKFNFNLDEEVQVGSIRNKNAPFYLEFAQIIKKRFQLYISSSPLINIQYVKADSVAASGKLYRNGTIHFDAISSPSKAQPYFNYLAKSIIDQPGKVDTVPHNLFSKITRYCYLRSKSFLPDHPKINGGATIISTLLKTTVTNLHDQTDPSFRRTSIEAKKSACKRSTIRCNQAAHRRSL